VGYLCADGQVAPESVLLIYRALLPRTTVLWRRPAGVSARTAGFERLSLSDITR